MSLSESPMKRGILYRWPTSRQRPMIAEPLLLSTDAYTEMDFLKRQVNGPEPSA
jgi:hypothetical protein